MKRVERVAEQLLKPLNPSVIIVLGLYTIAWGLWLTCPFWTVFTQAPVYATMAGIADEKIWGCIAIISGLFIVRGATKPSYVNLKWGALVGFLHWFCISLLYFAGDWANTGGITCLAFAVYSALVWVNIKANKDYYQ